MQGVRGCTLIQMKVAPRELKKSNGVEQLAPQRSRPLQGVVLRPNSASPAVALNRNHSAVGARSTVPTVLTLQRYEKPIYLPHTACGYRLVCLAHKLPV
jgi:hypothetical protein